MFKSNTEVERILSSKPWSFDKHILALQRYDKDTSLKDYGFNIVSFWVEEYDIPVKFQNIEVVDQICESIGLISHLLDASDNDGAVL